jgi:hypothetical protein
MILLDIGFGLTTSFFLIGFSCLISVSLGGIGGGGGGIEITDSALRLCRRLFAGRPSLSSLKLSLVSAPLSISHPIIS